MYLDLYLNIVLWQHGTASIIIISQSQWWLKKLDRLMIVHVDQLDSDLIWLRAWSMIFDCCFSHGFFFFCLIALLKKQWAWEDFFFFFVGIRGNMTLPLIIIDTSQLKKQREHIFLHIFCRLLKVVDPFIPVQQYQ